MTACGEALPWLRCRAQDKHLRPLAWLKFTENHEEAVVLINAVPGPPVGLRAAFIQIQWGQGAVTHADVGHPPATLEVDEGTLVIEGGSGSTQLDASLQSLDLESGCRETVVEALVEFVTETTAPVSDDFLVDRFQVQANRAPEVDVEILKG